MFLRNTKQFTVFDTVIQAHGVLREHDRSVGIYDKIVDCLHTFKNDVTVFDTFIRHIFDQSMHAYYQNHFIIIITVLTNFILIARYCKTYGNITDLYVLFGTKYGVSNLTCII